ncbi:hypothetical protein PBRA_004573 [Plasmodiophora brassicae]|uniref:DnaJ homolog subfamily C member 16 n=1 Tax=Plasmodiophora brassicae TaxID=37360 RepID=A0A0G4IL84_PLABS|nr:hypothetical protein PBRA_004573 [Plasmodiophora brassicae]
MIRSRSACGRRLQRRYLRTTWNQSVSPDEREHWFDRHMSQAIKEMKDGYTKVRNIIEIRDARMPYSSHPSFEALCGKPYNCRRLIVYTHMELIEPKEQEPIVEYCRKLCDGQEPLFTDLSDHKHNPRPKMQTIKNRVMEYLIGFAGQSSGHLRAYTVGFPNVGKSTFLYVITKATTQEVKKKKNYWLPKVANTPGFTTHLKPHWLNLDPPARLIDTPGIVPPRDSFERRPELFYKMALIGCLKEEYVHKEYLDILDFLLFKLNQSGNTDYVQFLNLPEPTDDVRRLLHSKEDGTSKGHTKFKGEIRTIINHWRAGMFGRIVLEDPMSPDLTPEEIKRKPSWLDRAQLIAVHEVVVVVHPGAAPGRGRGVTGARVTMRRWSAAVVAVGVVVIALAAGLADGRRHPNPYHILGVRRSDSSDAIRTAFKKLAKTWHPDKNPSNSDVFKKIRKAYDVLIDKGSRSHYDQYGVYPSSPINHQEHFLLQYAALGNVMMYHRDNDRFSLSPLVSDDTFPYIVQDNVERFGAMWLLKVYSNNCQRCQTISKAWENVVRDLQGVISVGRISFDLSPELVSRLKVQSVPAILAATPKAGEGYAVTFLPQKELSLLTTGRIRRFLGTIPTRTPCTQLATDKEQETFLSEKVDRVKIVFVSTVHRTIPVALLQFLNEFVHPSFTDVAYAYRDSGSSLFGNLLKPIEPFSSAVLVMNQIWSPIAVMDDLPDWYQLLSVDPFHLFQRLQYWMRPIVPELTYDTYFDTCFVPKTSNASCVAIAADDAAAAFDVVKELGLIPSSSATVVGWINAKQQASFLQAIGGMAQYRQQSHAVCVGRPSRNMFKCFPKPGGTAAQLRSWLDVHSASWTTASSNDQREGLPFLQSNRPRKSRFKFQLLDVSEHASTMMRLVLYGVLIGGALVFFFVAPSIS